MSENEYVTVEIRRFDTSGSVKYLCERVNNWLKIWI